MKRNIRYIMFAVLLLGVHSCESLEKSDPNSLTADEFYSSEADIASARNALYSSMKSGYYYEVNHLFTDVRAHNTVVTDMGANSGMPYQFYNYTLTEENTYVYYRYCQMFRTISRVNKFISHLGDVTYSDPEAKEEYEAEARYIRALTYYHLVTEWGDVPLIMTVLGSRAEILAADARKPKRSVYGAIFSDLDFVEKSCLADLRPPSQCGLTCKVAAYALHGKALLQYARDPDFKAESDSSLSRAISFLMKAWNLRPFSELSDIPYDQIWDLKTQKSCPECIFQLNFIGGNETLSSVWNYLYGPIKTGTTSNRIGEISNMATSSIYDMYDEKDVRKAYLRETVVSGIKYYHTMKYADLGTDAKGYGSNNWIVCRYADVVLMLAEAYYWKGDDISAQSWLNMVRKRAGLDPWKGDDLREGIYNERLLEFMQEGLAWQDALRKYGPEEMIAHYHAINSNFSKKDLLLPIPYYERVLNPEGLYQNPGYSSK